MRAAWMCAAITMRKRWISVVVLTLLVGVVGAVVLAAFAGARRTQTSFERFHREALEADLTLFVPAADATSLAHLRALPGVDSIAVARPLVSTVGGQEAAVAGPVERGFGRNSDRPRVLEGRRAREDRVDEIALPEPLAKTLGARVGETVTVHGFTQGQIDSILTGASVTKPSGPKVLVRVVGITRAPSDLSILGTQGGLLFTTYAFSREYKDQIGGFAPYVLRVRLADPAAAGAFVKQARAQLASKGAPGEFQVEPTSETEGGVQESIDVVATGLRIAAAIAGLVGLVVIAISLRRFVDGGTKDLPTLRGLGVSRLGRVLVGVVPVVPVAVGGALVAVVIGWAASPIMPIGLARRAEPSPGFDLDSSVLGIGALAVALVVLALGLLAAYRVVGASLQPKSPPSSRLSRAAATAGFAPPVTVGLSVSLESGRGASAVPMRSAVVGAVVAVTGIVAVIVFAGSLNELARTPATYGYNWDSHVYVGRPSRVDPKHPCDSLRTAIADDRAIAAVAATCSDSLEVDGHAITGYAFRSLKGAITPTVLDGRAPRAPDEVALGAETLGRIDAAIGDRVEIAGPNGHRRYRVVGTVTIPFFEAPASELSNAQAIADGAVLSSVGIESVSKSDDGPGLFAVRWKPGADLAAARRRLAVLPEGVAPALSAVVPLEVDRLEQVDALPWFLGGFLALIGIVGVGYALVTTVRRRGRDLAVLKTMGFRRAQVSATVATQATVLGVMGVVVGIPIGLVVGRAVWKAVASGTGVAPTISIPVLGLMGLALASIVIVNLVAFAPARRAARLQPAVVLRSE